MMELALEERAMQGWGEAALSLVMGFEVWVPGAAKATTHGAVEAFSAGPEEGTLAACPPSSPASPAPRMLRLSRHS